ncbi:MAG: pyridoxal phosphate-dependent aminotransferase [Candidatus Abawacabacteria bacterium]|nr:pyridoxal phosphate-dependent aminotransferase [Candidatus Abawacabacteria bacterium]
MTIDLRTENTYVKYTNLMQEGRNVFAAYFDVPEPQIIITCGATGALHAVFSHFSKYTLAIMPFEYFDIFNFADLHQCQLVIAATKNDQQNDINAFCEIIRNRRPQLVYISLPNNPLGQSYSEHEVIDILTALTSEQVCVFDQTLLTDKPFSNIFFRKYGADKRIIVIGSFSKSHNLVNERIGYMFMPCVMVPFHPYAHAPSAHSLKKVMRVISSRDYAQKTIKLIEANNKLIKGWADKHDEFCWFDSNTNFGALHVRKVPIVDFARKLARADILVKTNYDLKCPGNFLRVHLGEPLSKIKKFLKVLSE